MTTDAQDVSILNADSLGYLMSFNQPHASPHDCDVREVLSNVADMAEESTPLPISYTAPQQDPSLICCTRLPNRPLSHDTCSFYLKYLTSLHAASRTTVS